MANIKAIIDSIVKSSATTKPEEVADTPTKKPEKDEEHWGVHTIIDAAEANDNINKPEVIKEFLADTVKQLKMKTIGDPVIVDIPGRGVSAVQIITTSTLTIHTDDVKMSLYADFFSCSSYNPQIAIDLIKKYFNPKHLGYKVLYRDAGKYPLKEHSNERGKT